MIMAGGMLNQSAYETSIGERGVGAAPRAKRKWDAPKAPNLGQAPLFDSNQWQQFALPATELTQGESCLSQIVRPKSPLVESNSPQAKEKRCLKASMTA